MTVSTLAIQSFCSVDMKTSSDNGCTTGDAEPKNIAGPTIGVSALNIFFDNSGHLASSTFDVRVSNFVPATKDILHIKNDFAQRQLSEYSSSSSAIHEADMSDVTPKACRQILIIYTGGTIGMKRTPNGYMPVAGYMERQLKTFQAFQDADAPPRTLPISQFGERIRYDIIEYEPS